MKEKDGHSEKLVDHRDFIGRVAATTLLASVVPSPGFVAAPAITPPLDSPGSPYLRASRTYKGLVRLAKKLPGPYLACRADPLAH